MYFPHAFRKSFLPASTTLASSGGTDALTAGQIGFFDAKTFQVVSAQAAPFILAEGSRFASDKIGPVHGGYKESKKSKAINPKYISRLIKVSGKAAKNQIIKVEASACAGLACDSTVRLRVDVKGSPALRFLNHQLYKTLDAYTGCCDSSNSAIDHTVALLKWADQINEAPLLKDFIQAKVWKETTASVAINPTSGSATIVVANADAASFSAGEKVVHASLAPNSLVVSVGAADSASSGYANVVLSAAAVSSTDGNAVIFTAQTTAAYVPATSSLGSVNTHMDIIAAYVDTTFGNCTFTPTDKYDLEPLFIYASVVDESGDPCKVECISVAEVQAPQQASGVGESVLRDLILDGRYLQNAYPDSSRVDSLRMREIEADPALATVTRSGLYDQVLILHNVPRFNNPTSTFDNDQYLLVVHVPAGTATTSITNFIVNSCSAAGNAVSLESF
jgi:hypothetical protein